MVNFFGLLCLTLTVGVCLAQNACDVIGDTSHVICISFNQFKLQESSDKDIFTCPTGTFCADVPAICTKVGEPACPLVKICRTCLTNSTSSCITDKKYMMCENGQLTGNEKYCQASKPYCSMRYDVNGVPNVSCTNVIGDIACDGSETTTPKPTEPGVTDPPPVVDPDACKSLGKFPIIGDITCKRYYYCFMNDKGEMEKLEFVCPYQTLYNPLKGKCVTETGNFKCIP